MRLADVGKTPAQLSARSEHVAAFVHEHAGWQAIVADLERRRDELSAKILDGRLDDDTYRRYSAERQGIVYALETPTRLIQATTEAMDHVPD